jgi:hypothetical protein
MMAAEDSEIALYTESGSQLGTMEDVIEAFFPKGMQELPPTKIVHQFEQPTFIRTGLDSFSDPCWNGTRSTRPIYSDNNLQEHSGKDLYTLAPSMKPSLTETGTPFCGTTTITQRKGC